MELSDIDAQNKVYVRILTVELGIDGSINGETIAHATIGEVSSSFVDEDKIASCSFDPAYKQDQDDWGYTPPIDGYFDGRQMASIPRQWTEQETEQFVGRNVTLYTPGKPFPLFERLGNIFGKDRATGLDACSGKDAEEDVTPGSTFAAATTDGFGLGGDNVDMEDLAAAESELPNTFSASFASSSEKNQGRHSATKKSNDTAVLSNLAETFKAAVEDQGKHVQVLANAMSGVNEQMKPLLSYGLI
ncbi:hypothetical protein Ahy_A08g039032 [Arachis hypogaea]|uniref:Uncharacterized protein n=1 Tax=Arachis hypogaea TaxID=3818 RepID=A0A445BV28_ARAHY|nr:hypothetical protein Ahy_A08g039032 [Arachis hypogaea]